MSEAHTNQKDRQKDILQRFSLTVSRRRIKVPKSLEKFACHTPIEFLQIEPITEEKWSEYCRGKKASIFHRKGMGRRSSLVCMLIINRLKNTHEENVFLVCMIEMLSVCMQKPRTSPLRSSKLVKRLNQCMVSMNEVNWEWVGPSHHTARVVRGKGKKKCLAWPAWTYDDRVDTQHFSKEPIIHFRRDLITTK